jgi:hypothetical protein
VRARWPVGVFEGRVVETADAPPESVYAAPPHVDVGRAARRASGVQCPYCEVNMTEIVGLPYFDRILQLRENSMALMCSSPRGQRYLLCVACRQQFTLPPPGGPHGQ